MAKRATTPFSRDNAPPAVRQKREIAEETGQSLATTFRSDPMSTLDLTDQQHKDLDCQILKILENIPQNDWLGFMYIAIYLTCEFSSGTLPAITVDDAQRLVREHGELEEVVREALESKSFRRIRKMGEISTRYPIFVNLHKSPRNLTMLERTESRCKSTWRCR